MKRVASTVLLAMVCLLCLAEGWTPDNLPMPYLQDNTKYVVNPDGVLTQQAEDSLNRELYRLEHDLGVQTVLIAVKHIDGDDPFTFGMQLGKKYGIGQKERNNGLIFMLCNEDRSYTILPGKGLEASLPDAICRRIQNRFMLPQLREGAWDEAMLQAMNAMDRYIRGDEEYCNSLNTDDDELDDGSFLTILSIFGLFFGFMVYLIRKSNRRDCPRCGGKGTLRRVKSTLVHNGFNKQTWRVIWRCKNCGYTTTEDITTPTGGSSGMGSAIIGGSLGGLGRGGGSIGGSFGGGSFGGGGSTGRF